MKPSDCLRLENDNTFKGKYLRLMQWWKTPAVIAPLVLLSAGVFFLIYLLKLDLLLSWHSIFYIAIFLLGTIWFKSLKRHFFKTKLEDPNSCKVCLGKPFHVDKGYSYIVFNNNQKRHNHHFINNIAAQLSENTISTQTLKTDKPVTFVSNNEVEADCFLIKIANSKIKKAIANREDMDIIPLLYITPNNVFVISKKDQ